MLHFYRIHNNIYEKAGIAREQTCITQSKKKLIMNRTEKDFKRWPIWGIKRNIVSESQEKPKYMA